MKLEDVVGGEERQDETNTMAERRIDVNILLRTGRQGIVAVNDRMINPTKKLHDMRTFQQ